MNVKYDWCLTLLYNTKNHPEEWFLRIGCSLDGGGLGTKVFSHTLRSLLTAIRQLSFLKASNLPSNLIIPKNRRIKLRVELSHFIESSTRYARRLLGSFVDTTTNSVVSFDKNCDELLCHHYITPKNRLECAVAVFCQYFRRRYAYRHYITF